MVSFKKNTDQQMFDLEFEALLNSSSHSGRSLISWLEMQLRFFNLNSIYSVNDILSEAYIRGTRFINTGQKIVKPLAWIKYTCLNIIREISRSQQKIKIFEPATESGLELLSTLTNENSFYLEAENEMELNVLLQSFEELSLREQTILILRVVDNLSWEQVGEHLTVIEEKFQSTTTLRKQGQRALSRLRKIFYSKYNYQITCD